MGISAGDAIWAGSFIEFLDLQLLKKTNICTRIVG